LKDLVVDNGFTFGLFLHLGLPPLFFFSALYLSFVLSGIIQKVVQGWHGYLPNTRDFGCQKVYSV